MLQMGASRPWPDALQALTGQREMDATRYSTTSSHLWVWLERENRGAAVGGDQQPAIFERAQPFFRKRV